MSERFTDAQGVTHAAAVLQIAYCYENSYSNSQISISTDGTQTTVEHAGRTINYGARYWPSQALRDAGHQPYTLVDLAGNSAFSFDGSAETFAGLDSVAAAEQHLITVIIPGLQA